ncbi:MAG: hypothetical protein NXI20_03120 [bacterium]|nr:hypothetical protein [bacterium]
MSSPNYFDLNLTATTKKLYDYLKNTCISHGSYLNPIKIGSFIHGWTDNNYDYDYNGKPVPAIDESLPIIDNTYDAIRWRVKDTDWINYDSRISKPQLLYVEVLNLNPLGDNYDQPMSKSDWKKYFTKDGDNGYHVAPNGRLYLSPDEDDPKSISTLISSKNNGIYAGFNVAFLLQVDKVNYCCIIDPVIDVKKKKD